MRIKILLSIFTVLLTSCAKLDLTPKAEYKIDSTRKKSVVKNKQGEVLGYTPLLLQEKDLKESIEGKFAILYVEKDGFLPRVLVFDSSESLSAKINLELDKDKRRSEIDLLRDHVSTLKSQLDKRSSPHKNSTPRDQCRPEQKANRPVITNQSVPLPQKTRTKIVIKEKPIYKKQVVTKKFPVQEILLVQYQIIAGEMQKARKRLLELETAHPDISEIYSILAYLEYKAGNVTKAKKYLKKSLKINKKDLLAMRLRQFL